MRGEGQRISSPMNAPAATAARPPSTIRMFRIAPPLLPRRQRPVARSAALFALRSQLFQIVVERRDKYEVLAGQAGRRRGERLRPSQHFEGFSIKLGMTGAARHTARNHAALATQREAQSDHTGLATVQGSRDFLVPVDMGDDFSAVRELDVTTRAGGGLGLA